MRDSVHTGVTGAAESSSGVAVWASITEGVEGADARRPKKANPTPEFAWGDGISGGFNVL